MKKMIIVWLFLATCLFGSILFIGFSMNKEYKPYRDYEADISESANIYMTINEEKLKSGEKKKIKLAELLKSGALSTNKVKDDECDGYVIVKKSGGEYQYNAYIKCQNYTSVDYKE